MRCFRTIMRIAGGQAQVRVWGNESVIRFKIDALQKPEAPAQNRRFNTLVHHYRMSIISTLVLRGYEFTVGSGIDIKPQATPLTMEGMVELVERAFSINLKEFPA